jgi:hypothetical protein
MSDQPTNLGLELLREIRRDVGDVRHEVGEQRLLALALAEQGQRLERRMTDLERRMGEMLGELELMLKTELMGRMGHFETRMEARIEELASRIGPH